MRRDEAVPAVDEGLIGGQRRLLVEDVDAGGSDGAAVECVSQVLGDDDGTAGDVDEDGGFLHHGKFIRIDHAAGGVVERAVEDDDVGFFEEGLLGDLFDVIGGVLFFGAAVCQNIASERVEELRGAGSDLAESDDADRFALEFGADEAVFGLSGAAAVFDGADAAKDAQDHAEDQLGDRFVGVAGGVADGDAFFFGGVEADVVDARKGDVDEFEVGTAADDFGGHGHVGDDHGVGVFGLFDQCGYGSGAGEFRKGVSFILKRFLSHGEFLGGDAEGFHNDNLAHGGFLSV